MFSNTIVTAYRNSKSLSDHLIHSKLHGYEHVDKSVGTFHCFRPRCNTCSYVHNANISFGTSDRYIKILNRLLCISEAAVYYISCELCDSLYIGQTCRRLADRITEHLRDFKMNIDKPVSKHFNSPGHNIKNLKVFILKEIKRYRPLIPFCIVSLSLQHGPRAIWAYIEPVLKFLQDDHSQINVLHFFSNGPVTQYKQKRNFCLLSRRLFLRFRLGTVTWNVFEVRSFMGLCSYYRRFIKNFSDIAQPIKKLTCKGQAFIWLTNCQLAFDKLKEQLTKSPIMAYPREDCTFIQL